VSEKGEFAALDCEITVFPVNSKPALGVSKNPRSCKIVVLNFCSALTSAGTSDLECSVDILTLMALSYRVLQLF